MWKQNRTALKYSLISSPSPQTVHQSRPIKKNSLFTSSNLHSQKSFFTKQCNLPSSFKHDSCKSLAHQAAKEVGSIQKDLVQCVSSIAAEQGRNGALKALIGLLRSQMREVQESEKQVKEVEKEEVLRRAHKIEYDIQQILQRHNEQIAKINNLKEQTTSARSDRVVFSKLFRKIEKQIKQHQEQYKNAILKTEIFRQKTANRFLTQSMENNIREKWVMKDEKHRISFCQPKIHADSRLFVTTIPKKLKKVSFNAKKSSLGLEKWRQESECTSNIQYKIDQMQTKIEKLLKLSQCSTCQEAIKFYNSITEENEMLDQLIIEEESKIEGVQAEIDRMKSEHKISEFCESRQISNLQTLASTRKIRSLKLTVSEDAQSQNMEIIYDIFNILGLCYHEESISSLISNTQILIRLQTQLDSLMFVNPSKKTEQSYINGNSNDHDLDLLYNKMERFETCDKILNKKQFQGEYTKELSKTRRLLRYRK